MEARRSPHTATSHNAIFLSLCQPAATVRLCHWFGELGNQTETEQAVYSRRFSELLWHRPLIWDFIGLYFGTIGVCKKRFCSPMRLFDRLGVCRVKWIGWDIEPGMDLTLSLSCVISCPKNLFMHLERLQCARPLSAMGLSARAIQNKHRNHFFPVALRMRIPQQTSKYWFWCFNLAPPCRLQSVSHGKSWQVRFQAGKDEAYQAHTWAISVFDGSPPDESIVHRAVIHEMQDKRINKNKRSTLIYQLCSVSPPVNFFAAHSRYDLSFSQKCLECG